MPEPELLKIAEAAKYLSVSYNTIYRMIQEGQLPYVTIRHSIRIRVDALDKYIKDHEKNSGKVAK